MPLERHPASVDHIYPLPPEGEQWESHRVHTNYFGFTIPEAELGVFIYLRCMPAFPLCQGGVGIWQGMDNVDHLDAEFYDYEISMPWPEITETTVTSANGLKFEWLEPGQRIRVTYTSYDDNTRLDVVADAVTPMVARAHVMQGEDEHPDEGRDHGGTEQIMHYTGELVLHGKRYEVDAYDVRDRSWNQVRVERQDAVLAPPICWTPMYFGEDLALNQISVETHDTDPLWPVVYDIPPEEVKPIFGWTYSAVGDEALRIVRVRRNVLELHPRNDMPIRQEIEIEDEKGRIRHFSGTAIATSDMPIWPNTNLRVAVYRWQDEQGRVCHSLAQEQWFDRYQRELKRRRQ